MPFEIMPYEIPMSAVYSLPGDVIEVKTTLLTSFWGNDLVRMEPGYYGLVSQCGERLQLISLNETQSGEIVAQGEAFVVPLVVLELETVSATQLTFTR